MVTENAKVFIDTNILLYAYSSSEIAKKEKVLLLLENEIISLSTQVINEFIWVMSRKFNVGMDSLSAELLKGAKGRKEISRKAKEAVERYGYSQKEVADYLGIHYSTVSRMVNKGILDYARNNI